MGTVQLELQSCEDAARCLKKAVAIKPDSATAHYNLGQAYMKLRMAEEAVACFRDVTRLAPDIADAHTALGYTLASLDRFEEARGALQQALTLDPHNAFANHTLGQVLMGLGAGIHDAIECFRKAVATRPHWARRISTWVLHYLPLVSWQRRAHTSRKHLRSSLDPAPHSPGWCLCMKRGVNTAMRGSCCIPVPGCCPIRKPGMWSLSPPLHQVAHQAQTRT